MKIGVQWLAPLELCDNSNSSEDAIYTCDKLATIPDESGVYVFSRQFRHKVVPLYVGQATSLLYRLRQQFNNVRLMRGIQNSGPGRRLLTLGTFVLRPGQKLPTVLDIVEKALIETFVNDGYTLINKRGVKIRAYEIDFSGNREMSSLTGRQIKFPRRSVSAGDA